MKAIAIVSGTLVVYWNSIIISLGLVAGLMLSLALCRDKRCSKAAIFMFFPFMLVFSLVICRFLHWDCNLEMYPSFAAAMTNYSFGGFSIFGVVLGALLAALIVRGLQLTDSIGNLLDTAVPGITLTLSFVRLSAMFGSSCHSKVPVTTPFLQRLPFAVEATDAAGNTDYRFATFFVGFIMFAVVTVILVCLFTAKRDTEMAAGAGKTGNIARLALVICGAIEIVLDSTRSDASMLHFALLKFLNKYVSFISLVMLLCAISILCVFVHYIKINFKAGKNKFVNVLLIIAFTLTVAGAGASEYLVQRYTGMYALYRSVQTVSAFFMIVVVMAAYSRSIVKSDS